MKQKEFMKVDNVRIRISRISEYWYDESFEMTNVVMFNGRAYRSKGKDLNDSPDYYFFGDK